MILQLLLHWLVFATSIAFGRANTLLPHDQHLRGRQRRLAPLPGGVVRPLPKAKPPAPIPKHKPGATSKSSRHPVEPPRRSSSTNLSRKSSTNLNKSRSEFSLDASLSRVKTRDGSFSRSKSASQEASKTQNSPPVFGKEHSPISSDGSLGTFSSSGSRRTSGSSSVLKPQRTPDSSSTFIPPPKERLKGERGTGMGIYESFSYSAPVEPGGKIMTDSSSWHLAPRNPSSEYYSPSAHTFDSRDHPLPFPSKYHKRTRPSSSTAESMSSLSGGSFVPSKSTSDLSSAFHLRDTASIIWVDAPTVTLSSLSKRDSMKHAIEPSYSSFRLDDDIRRMGTAESLPSLSGESFHLNRSDSGVSSLGFSRQSSLAKPPQHSSQSLSSSSQLVRRNAEKINSVEQGESLFRMESPEFFGSSELFSHTRTESAPQYLSKPSLSKSPPISSWSSMPGEASLFRQRSGPDFKPSPPKEHASGPHKYFNHREIEFADSLIWSEASSMSSAELRAAAKKAFILPKPTRSSPRTTDNVVFDHRPVHVINRPASPKPQPNAHQKPKWTSGPEFNASHVEEALNFGKKNVAASIP